MAKLYSGSDEYWKIKEHAERLYRKKMDARSSDERRYWADRCHDFIDGLREKYGYDDIYRKEGDPAGRDAARELKARMVMYGNTDYCIWNN